MGTFKCTDPGPVLYNMAVCSVILYIHAPVHIYGVTYYSTTTTSDVVVAITLQDPGT